MKTSILTLITVALTVSAMGQGNVLFQNVNSVDLQAYVYESDGVTKLSGTAFQAALINCDNSALLAQTGFLTGVGAGVFTGGVVSVPGVPAGSVAHLQVEVWNTACGSTFAAAASSGLLNAFALSPVLNVTLTGPPNPPAELVGLNPTYLFPIPEPSCLTLAGLGALFAFVRRPRASRR